MWHAYNLVTVGDSVKSTTIRYTHTHRILVQFGCYHHRRERMLPPLPSGPNHNSPTFEG